MKPTGDIALSPGSSGLLRSWAFAGLLLFAGEFVRASESLIPVVSAPGISLDLPVVSDLNGAVDYLGGWMNSHEGHNVSGRISLPLGEHFGLQGDALYTRVISGNTAADFYSGGAHFFWRNPGRGLLGLFAAGESGEVQYSLHAGIEGEYYLRRFTLGLSAGVGHLKYDQPVSFFDTDQTRIVGSAFVAWYPVDQLMFQLGYANLFENHLGQAVAEYQTPLRGLA